MDKLRFARTLQLATQAAVSVARRYVVNDLDGTVTYQVVPNQSPDEPVEGADEARSHSRPLPDDKHRPWNAERVVDHLWREGTVPEWIDISVSEASATEVCLQLLTCERYTADEDRLYYTQGDMPPFGIKSPDLPPGWESDHAQFDLHWRRSRVGKVKRDKPWWRLW